MKFKTQKLLKSLLALLFSVILIACQNTQSPQYQKPLTRAEKYNNLKSDFMRYYQSEPELFMEKMVVTEGVDEDSLRYFRYHLSQKLPALVNQPFEFKLVKIGSNASWDDLERGSLKMSVHPTHILRLESLDSMANTNKPDLFPLLFFVAELEQGFKISISAKK